jgi:hypothetical protein
VAEEVSAQVPGACVAFDDKAALLIGPDSATWAQVLGGTGEARVIADESVRLRLALVLLSDPRFFVPHTVMDDFGQTHTGAHVFDWIAENTYSQPRADVFGAWADGGEDQVFAREVDAESSPVVIAQADGDSPVHVAAAFILSVEGADAIAPVADLGLPPPMNRALRGYVLNTAHLDPADPAARRLLRLVTQTAAPDLRLSLSAWRAWTLRS